MAEALAILRAIAPAAQLVCYHEKCKAWVSDFSSASEIAYEGLKVLLGVADSIHRQCAGQVDQTISKGSCKQMWGSA